MDNITFEEFKKLDLRVAEVKEVEEVEGADRLYKLKVLIGDEERQLIAGIKNHYAKEQLIGKKIAVITNLEPRTIKGVASHGMLLAASTDDKSALALLVLDRPLPSGLKIS